MFILRSWWIEINLWDTAGAFSRVGRNGTTKVFQANDPKTGVLSLSCAEAFARYPNKNNNNWKIDSARGTMGRGEKWAWLPLFSLPIIPRALSFFPLASLPKTQRGLWGSFPETWNDPRRDGYISYLNIHENPWVAIKGRGLDESLFSSFPTRSHCASGQWITRGLIYSSTRSTVF